ncbi:MmcQ/YjbR family DNA-binding protein [Nocardia pseudobrasiliensis]|uniref:Putative DNA-binding protein (MmcQ/YjbR family) n=1 Tax=Nocardia pseudobrasiliensis TaxID=45979 RepID=A0A370I3Q1_9NOCA|nr:MmcQ/YjbR family DNA-binding protein [Nocardia pseudobrasiliensis]RDI63944.1 putative DNA-binding protein (MmcQ/YjbR family) [Nocardia pseudobrasiliensis]
MDLLPYCLSKPGAREDEPWEGDVVAKVGDKIFAFVGPDSVTLKCGRNREEADELVRVYPDEVSPSAYIGRYGWNTVRLGGTIPLDELHELIDISYDAIVAKLPKSKRPAS